MAGVRHEDGHEIFNWRAADLAKVAGFGVKPKVASAEKRADVVVSARERDGRGEMRAPATSALPVRREGGLVSDSLASAASAQNRKEKEHAPVAVRAAVPAEAAPKGRVWSGGEAGGVVVVLAAEGALDGEALALVRAMLAAVACAEMPLGFVGVGGLDGVAIGVGAEVGAAMGQAVVALNPTRVLVLGGVALQAWQGKAAGVELWKASDAATLPGFEGCDVPVGATYAPEMLLARPVMKRLAWRHLLAWRG